MSSDMVMLFTTNLPIKKLASLLRQTIFCTRNLRRCVAPKLVLKHQLAFVLRTGCSTHVYLCAGLPSEAIGSIASGCSVF